MKDKLHVISLKNETLPQNPGHTSTDLVETVQPSIEKVLCKKRYFKKS